MVAVVIVVAVVGMVGDGGCGDNGGGDGCSGDGGHDDGGGVCSDWSGGDSVKVYIQFAYVIDSCKCIYNFHTLLTCVSVYIPVS